MLSFTYSKRGYVALFYELTAGPIADYCGLIPLGNTETPASRETLSSRFAANNPILNGMQQQLLLLLSSKPKKRHLNSSIALLLLGKQDDNNNTRSKARTQEKKKGRRGIKFQHVHGLAPSSSN